MMAGSRLSPLLPFGVLNYSYGLTNISFRKYATATWLGMAPGTLLYVYLGAAANQIGDVLSGRAVEGGLERGMFFAGLMATLAVSRESQAQRCAKRCRQSCNRSSDLLHLRTTHSFAIEAPPMKTNWLALFIVAFGTGSWAAIASDWPQWRGPERSGLSRETGLLRKWPEAGPKLLWQVNDVGNGYSTPAVVGDRIYLLGNEGLENEFVEALAVSDGKKVWSTPIGKVGPNQGPQYPGARSTPTVDGQWLFALGSDGDLVCLETVKGSQRWQRNLRSEFGGKPGAWAYAESPLIDGDVLVCTPGGAEATIVALDKTTGNLVWKSALPEADAAAYASVIVVEADGVKQYVQFLGKGIVGIDAKTGKFLWRYDKTAQGSPANIPTPVAQEGQVYSGTGRGGGGLVKLHADNGEVTAEQVYFNKGLPSSIGGAVLLEGFLYGTNGQSLLCVDFATGEIKWQDRCIGPGAVCCADQCLYIHGENGDAALVEATSDGYHELGRFAPANQPDRKNSKAWAYPVVAGGRLYLRDLGTLWCYDVSAAGK